ncbi:MAG: flagellar basal body protein [Pirellulales bacterium]
MLSSLFDANSLPVLERVVNFTQARHGVLAGNIANLNTPGYKTRDLSPQMFQQRLRDAIDARDQPVSPTQAMSIGVVQSPQERMADEFKLVDDSLRGILYHDETDISLENQVTEIAKNQQEHNLAINLMAAQFRLLRAAVTERVA